MSAVALEVSPVRATDRLCPRSDRTNHSEEVPRFVRELLRPPQDRASRLARLPTALHGEGEQKRHDSDNADDVRHAGKHTRRVTRVRPDQTDDRSDDEQTDHRGQPVEDPSLGDGSRAYSSAEEIELRLDHELLAAAVALH